jgi:4-amino-4-deoxy-L-arabinose transferase-like glycosyltransferase
MLAVALGLRLAYLGNAQLFRDEATSWYLASHSLADIFRLGAQETYPPLYLVLLKVWMGIFGSSETALRSLSVVAGVGVVIVTWRWVRDALGATEAWLAGLLVAVSPLLVANSRNARMYSLETLFATIAWWLIWLLVTAGVEWTGRRRTLVAAGIVISVAGEVWTLSLGIPSAGLQFLFVVVAVICLRSRSSVVAAASVVVGVLTLVPWLPNLISIATNGKAFWTPRPTIEALPTTFRSSFVGQDGGPWALALLLAVVGIVGLVTLAQFGHGRQHEAGVVPEPGADRWRSRLLALALILSFGLVPLVWAYSQVHSIYDGRYLANAFPPFAIAVAAGLVAVGRSLRGRAPSHRGTRAFLMAALIALTISASTYTSVHLVAEASTDAGMDPGRQVAQELAALVKPGDVVVAVNAESFFPLSYYLDATGAAQRLGITLFDWHTPTSTFYTGWADIDPRQLIEPATVARLGWRAAIGLAPGGSIWVVTLVNADREQIYFSPLAQGQLVQRDRILVAGNGRIGQIRRAVPAAP